MSLARASLAALALTAALAFPARAELSQSELDAAVDTIEQYGREMTGFLPCAPIIFIDTPLGGARYADDNYGDGAMRKAIGEFIDKNNGSRSDERELMLTYLLYATPEYVQDIRTLTEFCREQDYLKQAYEFRGVAVPLSMRPPFNGK